MKENKIIALLLSITMLVSSYCVYEVKQLNKALSEKVIVLSDKFEAATISTDGKLAGLSRQYDEQAKKIAALKNTSIVRQEIRYVEKETPDDADVEIKTERPAVTVKVNDGPRYKFDLLTDESSKFEDGKLIVSSASSMSLDITQNEYKPTKWNLITAMNADKEVLGGLSYSLGHTVSANVFVGQGIKPYYGLSWQIGSYSKK